MRKNVLAQVAVMALVAASPMMAQGGVALPAGWMMRFDPVPATRPQPTMKDMSFTMTGGTGHFTSGNAAAIFYNAKDIGKGEFQVGATFSQAKTMGHEAYGLFIGGRNLQDSSQAYVYFVIKPSDGSYLIKKRESNARPVSPAPTMAASIVKDDPTDGHATNVLLIHVAKDSVHFIANGKLVKGMSKAELGMTTDGQVGVRINHMLDVTMTGYAFKQN